MELKDKCAIVTGGAMGIGLATSKRLLMEGAVVTLWDLNKTALEQAKEELSHLEKVDILINNAGFVSGGEFLERPDEEWERTIDVNLTAVLYTIRAFLPEMYERNSGCIVNISSAAGTIGVAGLAVYTATKWAVWGLTESLRLFIPGISQQECSRAPS